MSEEQFILDGYIFSTRDEYERARKEKETIAYLKSNTDATDMKALLRIYNRSIEKQSFHTVIGIAYMTDLRKRLIGSGVFSEESLAPIPANFTKNIAVHSEGDQPVRSSDSSLQVQHYKQLYESAKTGSVIKNIAIVIMVLVIFAMIFITYKTQYSVFTYFTNYKENMREEIIDEMEQWQEQLEQKEQELQQREQSVRE